MKAVILILLIYLPLSSLSQLPRQLQSLIDDEKETPNFTVQAISSLKSNTLETARKELMNSEHEFIKTQSENGWKVYSDYSTPDTRVYRPGNFSFIDNESKKQLFAETDKKFSYEPIGAAVSSSGDLGHV